MSTCLDSSYDALAWGSHLPALLACVAASRRPQVLELGVGHFSTPALHALCGALKRDLISVEQTREWYDAFAGSFTSPWHTFVGGPYLETLLAMLEAKRTFGAVLIDNSPGGEARAELFRLVLPVSDYVVVHDYHRENEEAIVPLLPGLRGQSWHVTRKYDPPTLVASYFFAIPESVLCL